MDSSVEAESIQVGSGFLAFEDMSRGFFDLAALFAISIPVLVFPILNLISWPFTFIAVDVDASRAYANTRLFSMSAVHRFKRN